MQMHFVNSGQAALIPIKVGLQVMTDPHVYLYTHLQVNLKAASSSYRLGAADHISP